jgi:hypothetical protein
MCQGGNIIWREDEQNITDILEPNGLFSSNIHIDNDTNTYYANIDITKTDMSSMYTWNEIDSADTESLCWRTFTLIQSPTGTDWLPTIDNDEIQHAIFKIIVNNNLWSKEYVP